MLLFDGAFGTALLLRFQEPAGQLAPEGPGKWPLKGHVYLAAEGPSKGPGAGGLRAFLVDILPLVSVAPNCVARQAPRMHCF